MGHEHAPLYANAYYRVYSSPSPPLLLAPACPTQPTGRFRGRGGGPGGAQRAAQENSDNEWLAQIYGQHTIYRRDEVPPLPSTPPPFPPRSLVPSTFSLPHLDFCMVLARVPVLGCGAHTHTYTFTYMQAYIHVCVCTYIRTYIHTT